MAASDRSGGDGSRATARPATGTSLHNESSSRCAELPVRHTAVVLFYKYFVPQADGTDFVLLRQYPDFYVDRLQLFCKRLCGRLGLKGRILIASEGINGTVSADSRDTLQRFIGELEAFDLVSQFGLPDGVDECPASGRLFKDIDWKHSTTGSADVSSESASSEPFPDLKVSRVSEIISTGGTVTVDAIAVHGGRHLSPTDFHHCLLDYPDAVIIDVRNTFEYAIGHFVNPTTQEPALNPETSKFSFFDATFCATNVAALRNKKVLMYCTGGIRCEKASCLLKMHGVSDVSQLSGGIHRYLEAFGDTGFFQGKNFVFDQRVAQKPSECGPSREVDANVVVGKCTSCNAAFDDICGSRICTVCRDLVLVCPICQSALREYHCARHQSWNKCFFTFIDIFGRDELAKQHNDLIQLRESFLPAAQHKNVRRTLFRQAIKVAARMEALDTGTAVSDSDAPRRCRTCMETKYVCNGRCWGFWKTYAVNVNQERSSDHSPDPIAVGDLVEPGPDWNELRLGSRVDGATGQLLQGAVMEIKTWGAGSAERDCVAVCWNRTLLQSRQQPLIFRWGVLALNGKRMYDLHLRKGSMSFDLSNLPDDTNR